MSKIKPTLAGIAEEVRLLQLDAAEPDLPGRPQKRFVNISEFVALRMREAAVEARKAQP